MKKTMVLAVLSLFFVAPAAFAENNPAPMQGPGGPGSKAGANLEQTKATALKNIDARIEHLQEMKNCISAAQNHDGLQSCRKKFREEMREQREQRQRR